MNPSAKNDTSNGPVFEPDMDASYSLEVTAKLTGVSSETILYYHEHGLIPWVEKPEANGLHFNDDALRTLRRIEHLRVIFEINESGIKLILHLMDELEKLRADLRRSDAG